MFSYDKKKQMVNKITKINKKNHLVQIFSIIRENNEEYTENSNGIFLQFDKLSDKTLFEIDNYLKQFITTKKTNNLSTNQDVKINSPEVSTNTTTQIDVTDLLQQSESNSYGSKYRLSNKEMNIIKRYRYDKKMKDLESP